MGGPVNAVGMLLWGAFLRVTLGLHATWLVNSATHLWGSRRFETRDDSRNNWWVALLSGGEGWHNNHHAHPVSARHGLAWYEIDPNYWGIWLLSKLGLARKIQVAKFDPENPKPAGALRALRPHRKKPRSHMRPAHQGQPHFSCVIPINSSAVYFRSFARTHSVPKNGSATTSTSTPAGKPNITGSCRRSSPCVPAAFHASSAKIAMHVVAKNVKKADANASSRLVKSRSPSAGNPRTFPPPRRVASN